MEEQRTQELRRWLQESAAGPRGDIPSQPAKDMLAVLDEVARLEGELARWEGKLRADTEEDSINLEALRRGFREMEQQRDRAMAALTHVCNAVQAAECIDELRAWVDRHRIGEIPIVVPPSIVDERCFPEPRAEEKP